jgi:hypothetical protein
MNLLLVFYTKNGKAEMAEEKDYTGPIPRVKEFVYCDEIHKGFVFNVTHTFPKKEIVIKIR